MKKEITIIVSVVLMALLVISCSNEVRDSGDSADTPREESPEPTTDLDQWCEPGRTVTSQVPGDQGVQEIRLNVINRETVTIAGMQVETCHMKQEFSGETEGSLEMWVSEDQKTSRTIISGEGQEIVTETWLREGMECVKMYDTQTNQAIFETCA